MEGIRNGAGGQVLLIDGLRTKAARRRKTKLGALGGRGSAHFQRGQQMMWQLANWFRRKKLESDLDRELHYHLDRRIIDLERSGLPTEEARRQALLELGGIAQIQEEVRDIWLTRWLRDFVHDLRFSARSIFRSPSFMATAVLSLALGIGATTALYSLIDQIVLRALPVDPPERLVLIDWIGFQYAETFGTSNLMSYPICQDLQQKKDFFEGVLCRAATTISASTGGEPKLTAAELVSGNYFSLLGVRPALGRLLTTDDDQTPGSSPVVVLSYDFWKNQLGGAADIVGRKVLVNQYPMPVVGAAAPAFHGIDVGEVPSLCIPAVMPAQAIPGFTTMLDRRTRLALGASRGRIGRQLLADSVLLAFAGGLLGVVMAPIAVRALIAFLPRNTAANNLQANIDTRLLLFAFLVSLVAGFLAGSAPALQAGRKSLDSSLRERGGTPSGGLALRRAIVTAQIAFTLILVIAAGLFVRTLSGLLVKGPGFDTSSLISFGIKPALNGYSGAEESRLIRRITEGLRDSSSIKPPPFPTNSYLSGGPG